MKALSVKNPYAYLICAGLKDIENRSRITNRRGRILIHSTAKPYNTQVTQVLTPEQFESLPFQEQQLLLQNTFTYSAIIGEVEIVDCIKNSSSIWAIPGQYHWVLKNPIIYKEAILNVKGALSLWNYDKEIQTR